MTTRKIDCSFLSSPRWQKLAFMVAFLATGSLYAEDQTINNLNDTDNSASVSVDGTLTLTNSADSSFGSDGKSVTATGLTVQAGDYTQTLTGALNIGGTAGSTAATISSGTLNLSGTAASLDSAGTVQINSGAKLLFTGATPCNTTNALTINLASGGVLEFTGMATGNHVAANSLTQSPDSTYNLNGITTKGTTISGSGKLIKTGEGTLSLNVGGGGGTAKIALSTDGLIDIQSGKFVNGGWSNQDWSSNYATLNIGATGVVDQWDGKIMQIGGLTGDAGAKIISSAGSTDATRGGFRIGAGTTSGQEFTYNGAVSLTNANSKFIKTGEDTQIITGAFSNSGVTTIESGVLNVSGSYDSVKTTIESGVLNVSGSYNSGTTSITGGTLKLSGAVTVDAGGMSFSNTGVLDLSEATSLTVNGALNLQNVAYTISNLSGNSSGIITSNAATLTLNNITGAKTYSGTITGNVKLVIDYANGNIDSNYAVLSGANTHTGGTEIAKGVLRIGALEVVDEGGNLVSSAVGTGPVTLSGGTIQNSDNSPTISQSIVLADGTASSIRSGWTNMTISLTGEISGGGSLEIANDSSSVKISHANNTYSGGTKIGGGKNGFTSGQGTLILGAENALGTGAISFGSNNSRLDLAGFSQTFVGIDNSNGSGGFYTGNAINNTVDGTATAIDLTVTVAEGGNYTYSGALPTLTSLTKSGAGAQKFGGALTVPTITVTGGVLELGVSPTTSTFDVQAGSILKLDASFTAAAGTFTGAGKIIVSAIPEKNYNMDGSGFSGDFEILTGIVPVGSSASFGTGKLILSGGTIKNYDNSITIANNIGLTDGTASSIRSGWTNRTVSLAGEISGGGSLEIANDSSSIKITHANNTYTGGTKIGGGKNSWSDAAGKGTLILGAENALGTGPVTFGAANSSLDLAGFSQTIGGLYDTENFANTGTIKNTGAAATLTLDVAAGKNYFWSGTFANSDKVSLVKTGEGIQTFAHSQSFTSTTIEEGGIMLSGEGVNFSGPIIVEPGAYLTTDPTDGVYHELAPFTGDLTLIAASNTQASRFALTAAPTFDPELGFIEIMVQEGANLSSGATFQVSNANPGATADADLESWLASGFRYEWNLLWDNANNNMTLQRDAAAVPEPTSWALLLLTALGAAFGWRRKKSSNR